MNPDPNDIQLHTLTLTGNNTYAGGTTIGPQTEIQLGNGSGTYASAGSGPITDNGVLTLCPPANLTLGNAISGTGNLLIGGTVTLTHENTFTGTTTVESGMSLQLGAASGNCSLALEDSMLNYAAGSETVSFASGITSATLGGLRGDNDLALENVSSSAVALSVGQNNESTIYSGSLTGTGSLTKVGTGTLTLAGANTFSGTTTVGAGMLVVDGSLTQSAVTVNGGTLAGGGTISQAVTVTSGFLSPGDAAPGILYTGDLTLSSGSHYAVEIDADGAGTGYSQTQVTGSVSLGDTGGRPSLDLSGYRGAADGSTIVLIQASGTVSGHFDGLPDGDGVSLNGVIYRINYTTHEVTLTDSCTVAVASSPNPSTYGQTVTMTATVTAASGSNTPSGTVDFYDGTTKLNTVGQSLDGSGQATYSISSLDGGDRSITVVYSGDTNFVGGTSQPTDQEVDAAATTSSISASSSPSGFVFGSTVTLTATVGVTSGTPTGTVEFYDGTTPLGSGLLSGSGSPPAYTATFNTQTLAIGDHGITAVYEGDDNFQGSAADVAVVSINPSGAGTIAITGTNSVSEGSVYTAPSPPSGYSYAAIDWGDGSTSTSGWTHQYENGGGDYMLTAVLSSGGSYFPTVLDNDSGGGLDATGFGGGGQLTGGPGSFTSVAVQPDGSIAAVLTGTGGGSLVRYDASGNPDGTTFDSSIPGITAVAVQPQSGNFDVIVAGSGFQVAGYSSDGTLDTSFGIGGLAGVASLSSDPAPARMLVQPDGKIVLVGLVPDGTTHDLVAVRYTAGGLLDSYANDTTSPFGDLQNGEASGIANLGQVAGPCDAAMQVGNRIVLAADLGTGSVKLFRLTPDGLLDDSTNDTSDPFGTNGGGTVTTSDVTSAPILATQPDGKILLAGGDGGSDFALVRYLVDGTLDNSTHDSTDPFGDNQSGVATGPFAGAKALAVQPGGKIVVAGVDAVLGQNDQWALARFNSDGTPDSGFGTGGMIHGQVSGDPAAMALQPDGKMVVVGSSPAATDAVMARFTCGGLGVEVDNVAPYDLAAGLVVTGTTTPTISSYAEGDDVTLTGSFSDPGTQESRTVVIDWGDGTTESPDTETWPLDAGATTFQIPAPSYAASGSYTISVTVEDAGGSSTAVTIPVDFSNFAPADLNLTLSRAAVNPGQPMTLSGTFSDPGSDEARTVTIDWGDGTTGSPDLTTLTLNAGDESFQADPHVYSGSGTYTVCARVADAQGCTQATTTVTVSEAWWIELTDFSASTDHQALQVAYTVWGDTAAPFTIGVYASCDGTTADTLLASYDVNSSSDLTAASHTVSITPPVQDIDGDYYLVASLTALPSTSGGGAGGEGGDPGIPWGSVQSFDGGIFQGTDHTVYVFGTPAADTVNIDVESGNTVIYLNQASGYTLDSSVAAVHVRSGDGDDTITAAAGVTLPLAGYSGSGYDTITDNGSGDDLFVAGDGTVAITHTGSGSATIDAGAGNDSITHTGTGSDTINGGAGTDTITTGPGNDTINFGTGATTLCEGNGWNTPEIVDDSELGRTNRTDTYTDGNYWFSDMTDGGFNQTEGIGEAGSSDPAIWTFADLGETGYYDVYVSWSPLAEGGDTSGAHYVVEDGTTPMDPVGQTSIAPVDQQIAPADDQAAGVFWHHLGLFACTSGTLSVELDAADSSSGYVLADAVRLVRHDAAPTTNLAMSTNGFSVNAQGMFSVTYTVTDTVGNAPAPPFSIGIYGSPDGFQPIELRQTYDISDPALLGVGSHTVSFAPDFGGLSPFSASENGTVPFMHYLLAKLDVYDEVYETSKSDNLSGPLAGAAFQASDGDLYVLPGTGSQSVGISQDPASGEITVGGLPFQGVGTIYVSLTGGGNTVTIGSGVTAPVVIYGGAGGDHITDNGSGGAEIHGGTAANTITLAGSGNDTVYAGPDGDTITDNGTGNNQIYGGAGDTITESGSGDDWIQLGDGGTINAAGSTGDDWLFAGSGSDTITGGGGNDVIQGGPGTNTLIGGTRLDEITGGSGTNFIYGNGQHDVLVGGSGSNYILPKADNGGNLASLEVENSGVEGVDQYSNPTGYYTNPGTVAGDFTYDGNIATGQNDYPGDYEVGYGGLWDFNDFDSGVRLGEESVTAVAVYATWLPSDPGDKLPPGEYWETNALYTITGTADGQAHTVTVNQQSSPGNDSPEPNDRPWKLLGVYDVNASDTLEVKLSWQYDSNGKIIGNVGGVLCVSDVMIHPLWPTVDIQRTDVTVPSQVSSLGTAAASGYVDWFDSWNPADISPEAGSGSRTEFVLTAAVDPLFAQAPPYGGLPWNWTAQMPAILDASSQPEVYFWSDSQSATPWQQGQAIAPGAPWIGTVWVSANPNSPPPDQFSIAFTANAPPGAGDAEAMPSTLPAGPVQATTTLSSWHVYWPGSTLTARPVTIAGLDSSTAGQPHWLAARVWWKLMNPEAVEPISMFTAPAIVMWREPGAQVGSALFFVDAVVKEQPDDPVYAALTETTMRWYRKGANAAWVAEKGFTDESGKPKPQTRIVLPNDRPAQGAGQVPGNLQEADLVKGAPWRVVVFADAPAVSDWIKGGFFLNPVDEKLEVTQVIQVRDKQKTLLGSITIKFTELMQGGKVTFSAQVVKQNP